MDILVKNIEDETYEQFKQIASENERTITGQVRLAITKFVEDNTKKEKEEE